MIKNHDLLHIKPIGGSQHFAFEELCCQLVSLESYPQDSVFYRKGIGADAGVECFVRFHDKKETGWQSKFFNKFDDSQKNQLTKSLKQALEKHPLLTQYIVCLPINLKDSRVGKGCTELERWEHWKAEKLSEAIQKKDH